MSLSLPNFLKRNGNKLSETIKELHEELRLIYLHLLMADTVYHDGVDAETVLEKLIDEISKVSEKYTPKVDDDMERLFKAIFKDDPESKPDEPKVGSKEWLVADFEKQFGFPLDDGHAEQAHHLVTGLANRIAADRDVQ